MTNGGEGNDELEGEERRNWGGGDDELREWVRRIWGVGTTNCGGGDDELGRRIRRMGTTNWDSEFDESKQPIEGRSSFLIFTIGPTTRRDELSLCFTTHPRSIVICHENAFL